MRRGWAFTIIGIAELLALRHVLALVGLNAGLFLLYVAAKRTHPRDRCRPCRGRGRYYHWVYAWMFRLCSNCGGNGRVISWGAARFGSPGIRELAVVEARDRKARRKRSGTFGFPQHR